MPLMVDNQLSNGEGGETCVQINVYKPNIQPVKLTGHGSVSFNSLG